VDGLYVSQRMKYFRTSNLLLVMILSSVLSAQETVIRADDPFLPEEREVKQDEIAQVPIPNRFGAAKGVNIKVEEKSKSSVTYRLINNSDTSVGFGCSGITRPSIDIEVLREGKWQRPENFMICGTGLYLANLAPKKSILFEVEVRSGGSQMRVGIQILGSKNDKGDRTGVTIWSPPIDTRG
jgi:hypothetical protein